MIGSGLRANLRAPTAAPPRIARNNRAVAARAQGMRRPLVSRPARSAAVRLGSALRERASVAIPAERGGATRPACSVGAFRTPAYGAATEAATSARAEGSRRREACASAASRSAIDRGTVGSGVRTPSLADTRSARALIDCEPEGASSTSSDGGAGAWTSDSPTADTGAASGGVEVSGVDPDVVGSGAADGSAGCSAAVGCGADAGGGVVAGGGVDAGGAAGAGGGMGAPRGGSNWSGST
jgi:hypothetical protein